MPFVAFKVYQMSVYACVFKFFVVENVLDELDVLGSVVFHGRFPVCECVGVERALRFPIHSLHIRLKIGVAIISPEQELSDSAVDFGDFTLQGFFDFRSHFSYTDILLL